MTLFLTVVTAATAAVPKTTYVRVYGYLGLTQVKLIVSGREEENLTKQTKKKIKKVFKEISLKGMR